VGALAETVRNLLIELAHQGVEVTVVAPGTEEGDFKDGPIRVRRVAQSVRTHIHVLTYALTLNVDLVRGAAHLLHEWGGDVDVVHAHDWTSAYSALYLKWCFNLPVVLSLYTTERTRGGGGDLLSMAIYDLEKMAASEADLILAYGSRVATEVQRGLGVPGGKVLVATRTRASPDLLLEAYRQVTRR
jgi:glycosyltransferase involved in cell wall biosynthesis